MNLDYLKEYEPLYIIGHKNPDTDTIISSKILSDIFNYYGIKSEYAILEDNYELDDYNKLMINDCLTYKPTVITKDKLKLNNYFLVDHNDPIQSVGDNVNIIGGIDHHTDTKKINNLLLTDYCCTALYIYSLFKDKYEFSNIQKHQIYMAFLNDSKFTKSSRYKKKDEELVKTLGLNSDYSSLFKQYFIPTDLSLGVKEVFKNGYKRHNLSGVEFESSYIESFNNNYLEEYITLIKNYPHNFLGIWINYETDNTYAYFKYNDTIKQFDYDFIASRATTITNDVLNYLNKKEFIKTK